MSTSGPSPNPTRALHTEPRPSSRHSASPLTPQSVLLDTAAIKPEPATYAEACGAKSTVKANLLHYSLQHISTLDHTAHVYTQCDRCAYAGLVSMQCRSTAHT